MILWRRNDIYGRWGSVGIGHSYFMLQTEYWYSTMFTEFWGLSGDLGLFCMVLYITILTYDPYLNNCFTVCVICRLNIFPTGLVEIVQKHDYHPDILSLHIFINAYYNIQMIDMLLLWCIERWQFHIWCNAGWFKYVGMEWLSFWCILVKSKNTHHLGTMSVMLIKALKPEIALQNKFVSLTLSVMLSIEFTWKLSTLWHASKTLSRCIMGIVSSVILQWIFVF